MTAADDVLDVILRSEALLELNRPADAVPLLEAALARHPEHAGLWGQFAAALLALDRPIDALSAAREHLSLAPHSGWGRRLTSTALTRLGWHAEAAVAARSAVRLEPDRWEAHATLAGALYSASRPTEAELREAWAAASTAMRLAPDQPETHTAYGVVALALREPDAAEAAFRRALALRSDDAAARSNLAVVELGQAPGRGRRRLRRAAEGFADALATDPTTRPAQDNLALVARLGLVRTLWAPQLLAVLYLGGPAVVLVGGAGVACYFGLRWRTLPGPVRAFYRQLARSDPTTRRLLLLVGVCWLLVAAVVPALALAGPPAAAWTTLLAVVVPSVVRRFAAVS